VQQHPSPALRVAFVYLDITLETNIVRLLGRRAANGRIETGLPDKTYTTLLRTRDRAKAVWKYAQQNYLREPNAFVTVPEQFTPEQSADLVLKEISHLWTASSGLAA
jgi:hypothetical protein